MGNYDGTRGLFDWSRKDCDIWVLNEMVSNQNPAEKWVQRADAVFQMHEPAIWRNPLNRTDPGHYDWLRTQTTHPVYMQERYDDVPMSIKYPLDEIKMFLLAGFNIKNVFSSTIAYCMALAIHQGYERIETYGIELGTETEYFHQREGFTFWAGYAVGRGIRVICETTQLLKAPLYGYEGEYTLPYSTFTQRIEVLRPHVKELQDTYMEKRAITARALLNMKRGVNQEALDMLIGSINDQMVAAQQFAVQDGGLQENERFVRKADAMREASGGEFIFSRQEFESSRVSMTAEHHKRASEMQQLVTIMSLLVQSLASGADVEDTIEKLTPAIENYIHAVVQTAMLAGAIAEDMAYLQRLDAGIRAAGGKDALEALKDQGLL